MNAVTPPRPDPPGRVLLALMATVLNVALLVFAYGFLSLILDRDVIDEPDAGPLVGPLMALASCAVVFLLVFRRTPRGLGWRALSAALGVIIAGPAVGAISYAIARDELLVIPVFFGHYVLSPFVFSSAVIAAVIVAAAWFTEPRG